MPAFGTETILIRCYEVGSSGTTTPTSFANYFQEAASINARALGFPGELLWEQGMAWVLTRLSLYVDRHPAVGESISIRTWPSAHERNIALRCYEAYDAAGEPVAWGTSSWLVIDVASRRMVPIPEFVTAGYPTDQPGCRPFATRAVPKLQDPAHSAAILSRKSDLDMNGHVNNARYVDWALEAVPDAYAQAHEASLFDITFRTECGAGTAVTSLCSDVQEDVQKDLLAGTTLHSLRLDDGTELCRARTVWRPRKAQAKA